MRRVIFCLTPLLIVLLIYTPTFAVSNNAEKYPNMFALFQCWEKNGYPDYVGSVISTDGTSHNLTVLLTDDDILIREDILSSIDEKSSVSFGIAEYSYNELLAIKNEIVADYLSSDEKIYSVDLGWSLINGIATGFGDSGKESRVIIHVDYSVFEEYVNKFYVLYNDRVLVLGDYEGSVKLLEGVVTKVDDPNRNQWLLPLFILMIVIVGVGVLFLNRICHAKCFCHKRIG